MEEKDCNIPNTAQLAIDEAVLRNFIVDNIEWDISKLNEFVDLCGNKEMKSREESKALKWIEKVQPLCHEFTNGYFFQFKYLQRLEFDTILITKEFFNVFADANNCLQLLSIGQCTFSDDINVESFSELVENTCNKLERLFLWDSVYGNTKIHQLFTDYLMNSTLLKTLSIQLNGDKDYIPNLQLIHKSNLEIFYLCIKDEHNLNEIIDDKYELFSVLKGCKSLNQIKFEVINDNCMTNYILESMANIRAQQENDNDASIENIVDITIMTGIIKLIKIFEDIFNYLQITHHPNTPIFGTLRMQQTITPHFVKVFDHYHQNTTNNQDNADKSDANVTQQQLELFEFEFFGKDKIAKLLLSEIMNTAKNITIEVIDHVMAKRMMDRMEDTSMIDEEIVNGSWNEILNATVRSFGIGFFWKQCVTYKQYSDTYDQDIIIIQTLNDGNKHKLKENLPIYFQLKQDQKGEEKDDDDAKDEDETDLGSIAEFVKDIEKNSELINKYNYNMRTLFAVFTNHLNMKSDNMLNELQFVINNNKLYMECKGLITLKKEKKTLEEEKEREKLQNDYRFNNIHIGINRHLVTHFDTIYDFLGDGDIKTTLYFVNKELFKLSSNKLYKKYAKHLYKINNTHFNKNKFLSIDYLDIGKLRIDKQDLYPLSLLHNIKHFRVGMVTFNKWDKITINDINQCFSNWNKLIFLDIFHLNDDCGSRYNGNPLNAELINTFFRASIKTLKIIHIAFYGKKYMFSKWVEKTDKDGRKYYKYIHHTDDKKNKHFCIYPDFKILSTSNQCVLEHFSFWTMAQNQDIMNIIYREIKNIKTINAITIQINNSFFGESPNTNMTPNGFKKLVLKWKNILTVNGKNKNETFYGKLVLSGITLKWLELIIKNEKNDWFWNKNNGIDNQCNLDCFEVGSLYEDIEDNEYLYDFMKLDKYEFVNKLYLQYLTSLSLDYRIFGKMALLNGFYTKRGRYRNQIILTQIRKDNIDDVQSMMMTYIEKEDENGNSNFVNKVTFPSLGPYTDYNDEQSQSDSDYRISDYYD